MPPRRIGLIANDGKAGAGELVHEFAAACAKRALSLRLETHTASLIGAESGGTAAELARDCDLIVVLGGDGTILQVVHELKEVFSSLLGINLRTLGLPDVRERGRLAPGARSHCQGRLPAQRAHAARCGGGAPGAILFSTDSR